MTGDLPVRIGAAYVMVWTGTPFLLIAAAPLGMALHLVLPWIALLAVLLFPRNFTLLDLCWPA